MQDRGYNVDRAKVVANVDGGKPAHMFNMCPCLTKTRAANGGHWLLWKRRRLSFLEMLKLQGMRRDNFEIPPGVSERQVRGMVGNAMCQSVLTVTRGMNRDATMICFGG